MALSESYRGLTDGIILYVLKNGDRHTDELKQIIDDLFFNVKLGTLYSVINRLKSQNLINEYRMSNADGSRRKYYSITKKGIDKFNISFADRFISAPQIELREVNIEAMKNKSNTEREDEIAVTKKSVPNEIRQTEIEKSYDNYLNGDYDFTPIDNVFNFNDNKPNDNVDNVKVNNSINSNNNLDNNLGYSAMFTPSNPEDFYVEREIDFDSVNDTGKEYKTLLENLYPKAKNENTYSNDEFLNQTQSKEPQFNYDDIYIVAEKEGVKIKTANDTNRYQGTKILLNLLNMHASIILLIFLFAELVVFNLLFATVVGFNFSITLKITLIAAIVPLIFIIIYLADRTHAVKNPPKFKDVLEISLIISISAIIITVAVASIVQIDYSSVQDVYYHILLPCLVSLNVPLFFVVSHFLMKKEYYQTV